MAPKHSKKAVEAAPPAPESDVDMDPKSPASEKEIKDENSPQALAAKEQRIRVVCLRYTYSTGPRIYAKCWLF
jgi:hypothetical protein